MKGVFATTVGAILLSAVSLAGCKDDVGCGVADRITSIGEFKVAGQNRYLILRVSGFQDKEQFFELYGQLPTFDSCGRTEQSEITSVHVDDTAGNPAALKLGLSEISVVYEAEAGIIGPLNNISVEVYDPLPPGQ